MKSRIKTTLDELDIEFGDGLERDGKVLSAHNKPKTTFKTDNFLIDNSLNGALVIHEDKIITLSKTGLDTLPVGAQITFDNDSDDVAELNVVMTNANEFSVRVTDTVITDSESLEVMPYGAWTLVKASETKVIIRGDVI